MCGRVRATSLTAPTTTPGSGGLACGLVLSRELSLAQSKALHLAGLGPRQRLQILDGSRIFVWRQLRLDEVLELLGGRLAGRRRIAQHDEGLPDPAARRLR